MVDSFLYTLISDNLKKYVDDLTAEGYNVVVQRVSGGSPDDIKEWVIEQYNQGSLGFVFIGDITYAWAEVSADVFPCDLFYMDLDWNWEDRDNDGDYEIHTSGSGDMGPEVFVGRIYASTINYDTEHKLVNDYLKRFIIIGLVS
ncbi:MAG: C25 family cysteine peptidase [Candidatus Thermoplasmatota archaeon]|nr:C25 family cysteine peptidase [Candidatus Thermoplasmatota archaeon]